MKALLAIALIAVCGAAVSVIYYFSYYLPNARKEEQAARDVEQTAKSVELARRCMDDGMKLYEKVFRERNQPGKTSWDGPEFHFSRTLNTCLVHTRYVVSAYENVSFQFNELWDVYGNTHVFYGWAKRDAGVNPWKEELMDTVDDKPNYNTTKYFAEKDKLFKE